MTAAKVSEAEVAEPARGLRQAIRRQAGGRTCRFRLRERRPTRRPVRARPGAWARQSAARGELAGAWLDRPAGAGAASYLAYMDAFWVLTLLSVAAVPLAMSLRKVKLGGPAPAAH